MDEESCLLHFSIPPLSPVSHRERNLLLLRVGKNVRVKRRRRHKRYERSVYAKGTGEELTGGGNRTKPRNERTERKTERRFSFFALIVACPLLFPLRSHSSLCLFRQRRGDDAAVPQRNPVLAGSAVSP